MLYIVALILPPLALLMVGAWLQGIINLVVFLLAIVLFIVSLGILHIITFPLWIICVIWAMVVVHRVRRRRPHAAHRPGYDARELIRLESAAVLERRGQRAVVEIVELAADRDAARQRRD